MKRIMILSTLTITGAIIICIMILGIIIMKNRNYQALIMTSIGIGFVIFVVGLVNLVIELFKKDQ